MSVLDDTICAIATPPGEGGIGIVRVSGSQAFSIAFKTLRLRTSKTWEQLEPFHLYLGQFLGEDSKCSKAASRAILDEVLVVMMRSPRSYTGENVVEVHCHGGPTVVDAVCRALIASGARIAEPGEFTKRAFLNGKLDLTQAEAVLDTIQAHSLLSLKVAQEHLQGKLSGTLQGMRDSLLRMVAHLEAGMDFVEEDIQFIEPEEVKNQVQSLIAQLTRLIDSSSDGRIIREGVRTVIMGQPNVGKSSLLNALLGMDRAIVSHIPGTTRDVLEESVMVEGILVRFFDTAGLRESPDELEQEGMNRAQHMIDRADVVVLVIDRSLSINENNLVNFLNNKEKQYVIVLNKSDLPHCLSCKMVEKIVGEHVKKEGRSPTCFEVVEVSARTGEGLPSLKKAIKNMALGNRLEGRDSVLVSRLRHTVLLKKSREALQQALRILNDAVIAPECLAMELRRALHSLGEIIGVVTNEDILDQVFRDFCIGK
ncbi:MAG: tRNA uridine-5-carboxymethylaminomethyl(34) synthesis GTPase MnmE [Nitrospirales bacterium]